MLTRIRSSTMYERLSSNEIAHQFVKYAMIGVLNVATFLALFNLLRLLLPALPAYVTAFVPCNLTSFFLNKRWAFRDDRTHAVGLQYAGFAAVTVASLAINTGLFALFLIPLDDYGKVGENLAALAPLPVSVAWNFFSYRYWTFRRGYGGGPAGRGSAAA